MRIPVLAGHIERRILANFRIEPAVAARCLPPPFRPKTIDGKAIAGVCLIRLRDVRPRALPAAFGISSENCAHRFAVEWDTPGGTREGVYIPRRDTSSALNAWVGGKLFPGVHERALFSVTEEREHFSVQLAARDGVTRVEIAAHRVATLPFGSVFGSLSAASAFFERGSLGYSATARSGVYDGLELRTRDWRVQALHVEHIRSSFFEDESCFPRGSVDFDSALLMQNVAHEWHGRGTLACGTQ